MYTTSFQTSTREIYSEKLFSLQYIEKPFQCHGKITSAQSASAISISLQGSQCCSLLIY